MHNPPSKAKLFTLQGPIPSSKITLECKGCKISYGITKFTDSTGAHFYPNSISSDVIQMTNTSYRGGSRGRVQGCAPHPPPHPWMTYGFLMYLVFCKKEKKKRERKTMWFVGVGLQYVTRVITLALILQHSIENRSSKLAPPCDQIKSKSKTNRDSLVHVFPRFALATCICFRSWWVHWTIVWVLCYWPVWLLWLWLYNTQLKNHSKSAFIMLSEKGFRQTHYLTNSPFKDTF